METDNLEAMSIDELDALSLKLKQEQQTIREERLEIAKVRARKSNVINIAARLNVNVSDLTEEQISAIGSIKATPRPGDVVAEVGSAGMVLKGNGGDDDA